MDWWLPEVGEWMASEMGEESQKVQISSNKVSKPGGCNVQWLSIVNMYHVFESCWQ